MRADDTLGAAGRKVLRMHLARMLASEPGTRSGEDAEDLHKMRVATRRMRAAWRVFDGAYRPRFQKRYVMELRETAAALGEVRDLDVQIEGVEAYLKSLSPAGVAAMAPLRSEWRRRRDAARERLLELLDSKDYAEFVADYGDFVETPGKGELEPVPSAPILVRDTAGGRIWQAYERVRAHDTMLAWADVEALHALRIDGKRLRYTLEFFREVLPRQADELISAGDGAPGPPRAAQRRGRRVAHDQGLPGQPGHAPAGRLARGDRALPRLTRGGDRAAATAAATDLAPDHLGALPPEAGLLHLSALELAARANRLHDAHGAQTKVAHDRRVSRPHQATERSRLLRPIHWLPTAWLRDRCPACTGPLVSSQFDAAFRMPDASERLRFAIEATLCRDCRVLYISWDLFQRLDILDGTCISAIESDAATSAAPSSSRAGEALDGRRHACTCSRGSCRLSGICPSCLSGKVRRRAAADDAGRLDRHGPCSSRAYALSYLSGKVRHPTACAGVRSRSRAPACGPAARGPAGLLTVHPPLTQAQRSVDRTLPASRHDSRTGGHQARSRPIGEDKASAAPRSWCLASGEPSRTSTSTSRASRCASSSDPTRSSPS